MTVLPWTLAGCSWYGIYSVANKYLWCAEKNQAGNSTTGLGVGSKYPAQPGVAAKMGIAGRRACNGNFHSPLLCVHALVEPDAWDVDR